MIFFGQSSLGRAVHAYLDHYHNERSHQGIGTEGIDRGDRLAEAYWPKNRTLEMFREWFEAQSRRSH